MATNTWTQNLQIIAREALPMLVEEMVTGNAGIIARNFDTDFADRGNIIQVKKPAVFEASVFDTTSSPEDITEQSVSVTLDSIVEVPLSIGSAEASYNIEDAMEQIVRPAMTGLAEKISAIVHQKAAQGVPYYVGAAGTTPSTMEVYANARKKLRVNKAPLSGRDKSVILDPSAEAKILQISNLVELDKSGMSATLRDAALGKLYGFNLFADQAVNEHTAGTFTLLDDVTLTSVTDVEDDNGVTIATNAVLTSAAGTSTGTLLAGDLLTVNGKQCVVLANATAAVAGVITAKVYVPLVDGDTGEAVTFPDKTARGHVSNLMFLKNGIGLVNRPLATMIVAGTGNAGMYTAMSKEYGLSVRVSQTYSNTTKKFLLSFDTLIGAKVFYPELCTQILG